MIEVTPSFSHLRRQRLSLVILWQLAKQIAVMKIKGVYPRMLLCYFEGTSEQKSLRLKISHFFLLGVILPITLPSRLCIFFKDALPNRLVTVFLAQPDHTDALFAVDGADRPVGSVFIEIHDIALIGQNTFELLKAHSVINSIVDRLPHEIKLGRLTVLLRKINAARRFTLWILDDRQMMFGA